MGRVNHSSCTKNKQYKKRHDTKRRRRDVDQIQDDITKVENGHKIEFPLDDDLPGLGQFYCLECARHFVDDFTLKKHINSKLHKRRYVINDRFRRITIIARYLLNLWSHQPQRRRTSSILSKGSRPRRRNNSRGVAIFAWGEAFECKGMMLGLVADRHDSVTYCMISRPITPRAHGV